MPPKRKIATHPITDVPEAGVEFSRAWHAHRRHVLDIAFRMLGNLSEAEDVVQEGFARLVKADIDQIEDPGGWLVVVVSRLCLDRLRSRKRQPTSPEADLGDKAAPGDVDPADRITLDDEVRIALHLVLERLSAAERTVFVLHDVFQYPFGEIGEIVGRTPVACRQLASRARRTLRAEEPAPRFIVEPADQRRVTDRFIDACAGGDLENLLAVLDPNVAGDADLGGKAGVRTVTGREAVATGLMRFLGPKSKTTLLSIPAGTDVGVVALRGDRVVTFAVLTVQDGLIVHIDAIADPVKLATFRAALGS